MHDRGVAVIGHRRSQATRQFVDHREFPLLRACPLGGPSIDLSMQESIGPAEVAESDGIDVDGVEFGEHVDEGVGGGELLGGVESGDGVSVGVHRARHELHQIERVADDRLVIAHGDGAGHGNGAGTQRLLDAVLAAHVVGGGEQRTHRRSSQHPIVVSAADTEGEIGGAAREMGDTDRSDQIECVRQPTLERFEWNRLSDLLRVHATGPVVTMGSGASTTQRLPL